MIKIKFINDHILYDVEFLRISQNIVQLVGNIPGNVSGFKTYKSNETQIGDFSDYTTIYKSIDGGFQFSNDGSVYPTPPSPEPPITFEMMIKKMDALEKESQGLIEKDEAFQTSLENTQNSLTDTMMALCDVYELIDSLTV